LFRFFVALAIALFFFAKVDILIWQRIFETNELWELGIGTYHYGWTYALFGFMALGAVFFFPHIRRMLTFLMALPLLAFSGIEDILYYWLDGRSIPDFLPWLSANPLLIQPVTRANLLLSAGVWLLLVVLLEVIGTVYLDPKLSHVRVTRRIRLENLWFRLLEGIKLNRIRPERASLED